MSITFTIELRTTRRLIERLHGSPRLMSAGEQIVLIAGGQQVLAQLRQGWPVRTGRSRAGWDVEPLFGPGTIGYRVSNDVDYAEFVHRSGEGPAPLWEEQLAIIRDSVLPPVVDQLASAIRSTEAAQRRQGASGQQPLFAARRSRQPSLGSVFSQARRLRSLVRRTPRG